MKGSCIYIAVFWWITFLMLLSAAKADTRNIRCQEPPLRDFSLPLTCLNVTSPYGWRIHPVRSKLEFHRGVDLAARNDPVYSIMDGIVCQTGIHPVLGMYIMIGHGDVQSIYGHLSHILVQKGQPVLAGQPVGITGSTGRVTGQHLHFSINYRHRYIHPLLFLKAAMEQQSAHAAFIKN